MPIQQSKKRGRPHRITDKQRVWINEYIIDTNGARSARVAGFKHPVVAAAKLLNPHKYPLVAIEVRKALAEKEQRAEMKAEDVLRYVHTVLRVCIPDYFLPRDGGGWLISLEDCRSLPPHVKQLVESCEMHNTETTLRHGRQVVESVLWVKIVSKTTAMTLACKYGLTERHSVEGKVEVDLTAILASIPNGPVVDEVELRIDEALGQPVAERPVNRLQFKLSTNGDGHH